MNFELTDEQRLLQDSVQRFARDHYDFSAWRARTGRGVGFDRGLWKQMADLGWLSLTAPEEDGGLGGSPVDTMVIMEGVGRALMLEPFVASTVFAPTLLPRLAGSERTELIAAAMAGTAVVTLADAEPDGRFDLAAVSTRAERTAAGFRLTGEKSHALDGAEADWFVVPARTSGEGAEEAGITLFLVARDAPGLAVHAIRAMDHRRNASLSLDGVEVSAGAVIGEVGQGFGLARHAVDLAIVARLAEAVGAMEAAYEQTLQHLKTRKQFGQAIGSFQALQHRAVDMAIACEEARSMTYLATIAVSSSDPARRQTIAAAKARVGQTSLYVARQAVQLHGGMGFSDELAIGHYLKRLVMIDLAFGNAAEHRRQFAAARAA
ncbi:MAG: acyl-CoA dehydrogenase family protein [Phenylobacterium sp.]|uniref:acyl-CoA dehydrogenase family protein n=1 Tax=Phenylobacterium sp. TaxID=1871053 RepID=UPI002732C304|nr:acyl-CoA dehydrogenase family protein [Phenylobacterium sp.]MDP3745735.1 acyl-CoA dehydrogenase family protein [Phenylobacterium sp.]